MDEVNIVSWTVDNVLQWAQSENLCDAILSCIKCETINGICLLTLNEFDLHDLRLKCKQCDLKLGHIKTFWLTIRNLQKKHPESMVYLGVKYDYHNRFGMMYNNYQTDLSSEQDKLSPPASIAGNVSHIQPEFFKTMISLGYAFLVTWITAFVMVVVHERVPDMKRYPPLPDIFLDNVPHIPWAFHMCELTGTFLFTIWFCVLTVHKHRMVLLRRFFALSGTVFLLRCITMLITSLSVPGTHLQCTPRDHEITDDNFGLLDAISLRISRAYNIWSGLGMSIQGVRTCGDYMFSGHTVALTILNFFITEYTPRRLYFLHTITWLLNMFGIFFILAAHEHYSIDVFVAFYITSRLFLYYHTLANNQALMSRDSNRTRVWFPMFSYFESSVDGIVPNEYDTVYDIFEKIISSIIYCKDIVMLTARRFWIEHNHQFSPSSIQRALSIRMENTNLIAKKMAKTSPTKIDLVYTDAEVYNKDPNYTEDTQSNLVIVKNKKDS